MKNILCIDDDQDICLLLEKFLTKNGYKVEIAYSGSSGLKKIEEKKFDLILCDFRLPDHTGLEMIKMIKEKQPSVQIIIITGYSDVRMAVKAMKYGAHEYVTKPLYPEEILLSIKEALKAGEEKLQTEVVTPKQKTAKATKTKTTNKPYVLGKSNAAVQVQKLVELVAPTDMTVLLLGESGTGKEVTAKMIHDFSSRKSNKFVPVDCGALPKDLANSELFGHKKGAFTGALSDKKGHFELANGGTLFLDEIGNLSYDNQVKLLRVIQERKIRPLGDTKDIEVDVRIIAATNDNLKEQIKKGNFREDIYYRINEFNIQIPTLNERKSDIKLYLNHFLSSANTELEKDVEGFTKEALDKLLNYYWPGNLREMKNVIKRATLLCGESKEIGIETLPAELLDAKFVFDDEDNEGEELTDLKAVVDRAEKKAIIAALAKTGYNKSKTAELLDVDRKTLYNKMSALGIEAKAK